MCYVLNVNVNVNIGKYLTTFINHSAVLHYSNLIQQHKLSQIQIDLGVNSYSFLYCYCLQQVLLQFNSTQLWV